MEGRGQEWRRVARHSAVAQGQPLGDGWMDGVRRGGREVFKGEFSLSKPIKIFDFI